MTLILKQLFAFLRLLNSETGVHQIATGISAGFILGMTPSLSLQSFLVFLCLFVFRIQIGAALLSGFFFAFVAYVFDPVFDRVGRTVLELDALRGWFTTLYNIPLFPLTRFNNSIVMGSGLIALALSPIIYVLAAYLVVKYRQTIVQRFQQTRFWKAVKATRFYQWYYTYEKHFGS